MYAGYSAVDHSLKKLCRCVLVHIRVCVCVYQSANAVEIVELLFTFLRKICFDDVTQRHTHTAHTLAIYLELKIHKYYRERERRRETSAVHLWILEMGKQENCHNFQRSLKIAKKKK